MNKIYTIILALFAIIALPASAQNISITGDYNLKYYPESGDWFFAAKDDSQNYTLRLDYNAPEDNPYGSFSLSDIITENSCLRDYTSGNGVDHQFLNGTEFSISRVEDNLILNATLVCSNSKTYTVRGKMAIADVITVESAELLNAVLSSEDNDWYIRFKDDKYRVTFDLKDKAGGFANTWTEADMYDPTYNMITRLSDNFVDHFVSFNITTSMPDGVTNPTESCEITGTAVGESGKSYNLHFKTSDALKPTKTEKVNVNVETAEWPSNTIQDGCYFKLTEKLKSYMTWELGIKGLIGEFNETDMLKLYTCRKNSRKGEILDLDNGKVTITSNGAKKTVHVAASLVMKDAVCYEFEFDAPISSLPEVNYSYSNLEIDESYKDWGITWMRASDDNTQVVLTLNDEVTVPGSYSSDIASVSFFRMLPGGDMETIKSVSVLNAATTLNAAGDPELALSFIGEDAQQYNISAVYTQPEITDVINLELENVPLKDIIEKGGIFQVCGYNADKSIYFSVVPTASQLSGHYTLDDLKAYSTYNTITFFKSDGSYVEKKYYAADFDVVAEGNKATLKGTFLAGNYQINMNLSCDITIAGIVYDTNADADVTFTKDHLVTLQKYDDRNTVYVILEDKVSHDNFSLYVYVDHFDDSTTIPVGTYNIDKTYKAPSVQAGMYYDNNVYPTFYAKLYDDGSLSETFWYALHGSLVVSENNGSLAFELNAQNSYKRNLHVSYNLPQSGIKEMLTPTPSRKYLDGRNIIIRHNNRLYNSIGQEYK